MFIPTLIGLRLAVAAGAVAAAPLAHAQSTPPPPQTPRQLVAAGMAPVIAAFAGTRAPTLPSRDAVMGFSLPTQITEVAARGGQEVVRGTLLLRGDDAEDQALLKLQRVRSESDLAVQTAEARMDLAKVEFERLQTVFDKGASGPQEVERARLSFEVSRLEYLNAKIQQTQEVIQLERLQSRLDRMRLSAPFDGVVDKVMADVGQAVSENEKVVRVVNVDLLWIDVFAPTDTGDAKVLALKPGEPAWVLVESEGAPRVIRGKVVEVAPTADYTSRSRRVRVEVANPKGLTQIIAGEPSWVRFTPPPEGVAVGRSGAGAGVAGVAAR